MTKLTNTKALVQSEMYNQSGMSAYNGMASNHVCRKDEGCFIFLYIKWL